MTPHGNNPAPAPTTNTSSSTTQATISQPLITWFSNFRPFAYDPMAGLKSNFDRLATQHHWDGKLKGKRWLQCQKVAFAALYADDADVDKLEKWQDLCREVYIPNPPNSIKQCKKILGSPTVLVNLVNLIDHRLVGTPVFRFKHYNDFRAYTSKGRRFPLKEAKEDGFIKALLRKL